MSEIKLPRFVCLKCVRNARVHGVVKYDDESIIVAVECCQRIVGFLGREAREVLRRSSPEAWSTEMIERFPPNHAAYLEASIAERSRWLECATRALSFVRWGAGLDAERG